MGGCGSKRCQVSDALTTTTTLKQLTFAAETGDAETLVMLVDKHHVDIDTQLEDHNDDTVLHIAAGKGHKELVAKLLEMEADVRAVNNCGETALHKAIEFQHLAIIRLLLTRKKCDVNARNGRDGSTGLHVACSYGNAELVKLLIESKAFVNAGDHRGTTPLMKAAAAGSPECCELLCEAGADVSRVNAEAKVASDFALDPESQEQVLAVLAVLSDWS
mmetsp:Transcript_26849/g.58585  ORF Transcript_26849/g.58585 Transcript_26849/m.58585 type:complete len:218 (-) Transcript_26849:902-1555(-)